MRKLKRKLALILAVCIVCALLSGYAANEITGASSARPVPPPRQERVTIYIDGILTNTVGYVSGGRAYISVEHFCSALGLEYRLQLPAEGEALSFDVMGMTVTVPDSYDCLASSGRYFYLDGGIRTIFGEVCFPVTELCRLVGAGVLWDADTESIDIDSTYLRPLRPAEEHYNSEDLYWLSRIIEAEAVGESLAGKLGVGNVVLNRVASDIFPGTVYEVVFDTQYGVQFSPVETGSIYLEPTEQSVIAAKMCLEGYNVVGGSLYFVNPTVGVSAWFNQTRSYVATIGGHDFYA